MRRLTGKAPSAAARMGLPVALAAVSPVQESGQRFESIELPLRGNVVSLTVQTCRDDPRLDKSRQREACLLYLPELAAGEYELRLLCRNFTRKDKGNSPGLA
jgi:hypothetical protein